MGINHVLSPELVFCGCCFSALHLCPYSTALLAFEDQYISVVLGHSVLIKILNFFFFQKVDLDFSFYLSQFSITQLNNTIKSSDILHC